MSITRKTNSRGFSLLEVMLVILIMTMVAMFALRMQGPKFRQTLADHAAGQMRQIMEAATAYYIGNGQWPMQSQSQQVGQKYLPPSAENIKLLTIPSTSPSGQYNAPYLPTSVLSTEGPFAGQFVSPFGQPYEIGPDPNQDYQGPGSSATYFEVQVDTQDPAVATLLKGKLPLAYITPGKDGKNTVVTAYLNIPSYDYNHANTLSDVGVYHPGDCIPAPTYACPSGMEAATFVTLEQAYGFSGDTPTTGNPTVSSITGFSASINPAPDPLPCDNILSTAQPSKYTPNTMDGSPDGSCKSPSESRACVHINTTSTVNNGQLEFDGTSLDATYILAMTKCVPTNS